MTGHIAGCYFVDPTSRQPRYLPQVKLEAHVSIISSISRATLTQTFFSGPDPRPEIRYSFPLYDGVSVVAFTCTIGERVIRGVVKEKQKARQSYNKAVSQGKTASLLEQSPVYSDVFTTTIGNVPGNAEIKIDISYLGELKHDAQVDGIRLTLPTSIAPRYGSYPGEPLEQSYGRPGGGAKIIVDAEVPTNSQITSIESPSHQLAVTLGRTSLSPNAEQSFRKASATLALGTAELEKDFILQVKATNIGDPLAVLEVHPSIPNQRALMATLVPKFTLPPERPEIVFVCDRSGSMGDGKKMPNLKAALRIFIKSLNLGTKFNICQFGSDFTFLWKRSRTYDQASVDEAMRYVDSLSVRGGTEMFAPLEETFKRRYTDLNLEVFLLTDGQIRGQERLLNMIQKSVAASNGAIRLFTLGIGSAASHSLIEGVARAGNGFSQTVSDSEEMSSKVVRMLKGAVFPHIKDYSLEIKYADSESTDGDDFEMVDKILDGPAIGSPEPALSRSTTIEQPQKATISLFDPSIDQDVDMEDADKDTQDRFSHLPALDHPVLLQAPCTIPPLFPFNRTSVYVLMSPDTPQHTPKAVILRGTSVHGPLELEIPITILKEKGETIHQLAAKKAVGELEEGRGWIFYAKGPEGQLLKDSYDSQFQDMVEREAVRLGVQYQVGGKWCSFVAVDSGSEAVVHDTTSTTVSSGKEGARARYLPPGMHPGMFTSATCTMARPRYASASMAMDSYASAESRRKATVSTPQTIGSMRAAAMFSQRSILKFGRSGASRPKDEANKEVKAKRKSEHPLPADKLQALVMLHSSEGFWTWNGQLTNLMGWDAQKVTKSWSANTTIVLGPNEDKITATACVLAWLRRERATQKPTWELFVDKAVAWLESELQATSISANEAIEIAGRLI